MLSVSGQALAAVTWDRMGARNPGGHGGDTRSIHSLSPSQIDRALNFSINSVPIIFLHLRNPQGHRQNGSLAARQLH